MREEIKAYWSERAATFDSHPGHEIGSAAEWRAWHALLTRHLGPGQGRAALDLATGTAVIAHLMDDLGFRVTGLDWSEPMLEQARAKAAFRGRDIDFLMGDAEFTMLPDASFDVIVTRHLVWTLVDPPAAFREWRRVLRPDGRLLVIDGDFVSTTLLARLASVFERARGWMRGGSGAPDEEAVRLARAHRSILERVPFAQGARADRVAGLLAEAGFERIEVDMHLGPIHRAQARRMTFFKGADRLIQHRYAIRADMR
nr:class I SAM-dependent methyltransferase [Acuticoccus kalidii]